MSIRPLKGPHPASHSNFIRQVIEADLAAGKHVKIRTRFPPEPNGYLHLGHAKSILINFGLAKEYGGSCNLRFDDTNPEKEEQEYVDSIVESVKWLGADFGAKPLYASDYFDFMYRCAEHLVTSGNAYVDSQSADEMKHSRGSFTKPGVDSRFRSRSSSENLDLLKRMKNGEFPDGTHVLRAKIDMQSPNINLRDPAIYRIKKATHHRTGARRRGYTPEGFHKLAERVGVAKENSWIDYSVLEDCMREHLNDIAPRRMAVLDPIKLVIENYPEGKEEMMDVPNHPQKPDWGKRQVPFSRELWIERDDFTDAPEKGYFRLFPGNKVRLRYAYVVECEGWHNGVVRCRYLPDTRSGTPGADTVKVKGNIHWVSKKHAHQADVRLYDRLFSAEHPEGVEHLNPKSVTVIQAELERCLSGEELAAIQFERHGYFVADSGGFSPTVTLSDTLRSQHMAIRGRA